MNVIVAADKNWGIGKNNQLLVSIPADMKMFREETSGKVVVMVFSGSVPLSAGYDGHRYGSLPLHEAVPLLPYHIPEPPS